MKQQTFYSSSTPCSSGSSDIAEEIMVKTSKRRKLEEPMEDPLINPFPLPKISGLM